MTVPASLPLAITMGDPAGCGPQITARAWEDLRNDSNITAFAIGDPDAFSPYCQVDVIAGPKDAEQIWPNALPVLALPPPMPQFTAGKPDPGLADAIVKCIKTATSLALEQKVSAVVTNPISKAVLYAAGFEHPGHTEYLAQLCANDTAHPRPVMMLIGGGLRVALATIHMPLMDVSSTLSTELLIDIARIVDSDLKSRFHIPAPKLVFSGLNPHAGEAGTIGCEEVDIINPAAASLRDMGVDMADARPADTVFAEALEGRYDAVIAMTHDQGLIPVKTLDLWGGVNCTLGLPIIRTSPDHGTAYDAAAAGSARPDSLIAAIKLAASMAEQS